MSQNRVLSQKIISADGRTVSEARSEVNTSDRTNAVFYQSITVAINSNEMTQSVSSCSSRSSSSKILR